ncbi:hypothetical protein R1sor_024528 [Riccia sorocarpa]|uniref:Transposase n=1 Tax=Riccia sorocarpa TaxID=122646 RepID=A0ABD3GQR5_9MARC
MERERFVLIVDIEPYVMLLIHPSDDFVVKDCFWVAKAVSGVIRQRKPSDPISMYEVKVEWYRPKHRLSNATDAQRYNQCLRNTQEWEKDPSPKARKRRADLRLLDILLDSRQGILDNMNRALKLAKRDHAYLAGFGQFLEYTWRERNYKVFRAKSTQIPTTQLLADLALEIEEIPTNTTVRVNCRLSRRPKPRWKDGGLPGKIYARLIPT